MQVPPLHSTKPPTDEELFDLYSLGERAFRQKHHCGRFRWQRLRATYQPDGQPTLVAPPSMASDNQDPEPVGDEELFGVIADHASIQRRSDGVVTRQTRTWTDPDSAKPIGILFTGDWHVGSQHTDHHQLLADMRAIGEWRTRIGPGALRLIHTGDLYDGFLPSLGRAARGLLEETETNIDRQERAAVFAAKQAGAWDVMLWGCHPAWQFQSSGRDPLKTLAADLGATNAGYGIDLDVVVGQQTYHLVVRHRTRRESSLNTTNAHRAIDDDLGPAADRADVIALGHLHFNDLQVRPKAGRRVVYLRSGSYKGGDHFARAIAATNHKDADIGNPVVILFPRTHHVLAFAGADWQVGLRTLEMLRKEQ